MNSWIRLVATKLLSIPKTSLYQRHLFVIKLFKTKSILLDLEQGKEDISFRTPVGLILASTPIVFHRCEWC